MTAFPTRTLASVCDISMGQAPKGDSYNATRRGYPLIAGAGDFGELTPTPKKYTDAPTKLSRLGDIILCIRATIGDRNWSNTRYCLGRGVAGLRAKDGALIQPYLGHWLDYAAPVLRARGRGATFLQVSKRDIASLQIPLPPLAEQKRIAEILDAADALRAKRRESVAQLDILLQSTFLDMFGDPVTNPMGWKVRRLKETKSRVQIGPFGSLLHKEDYIADGVPLVNPMHIVSGQIRVGNKQTVSERKAATLGNYRLQSGDVVMGRRGEMGRCAIVSGTEVGMLCGTGSLFFRPHPDELSSPFLAATFSSESVKRLLEGLSQGVTMPNLNRKMIEGLKVALPPLDLQHRYATIVESVESQKTSQRAHLAELDTLFASLQSRAFRGDL